MAKKSGVLIVSAIILFLGGGALLGVSFVQHESVSKCARMVDAQKEKLEDAAARKDARAVEERSGYLAHNLDMLDHAKSTWLAWFLPALGLLGTSLALGGVGFFVRRRARVAPVGPGVAAAA